VCIYFCMRRGGRGQQEEVAAMPMMPTIFCAPTLREGEIREIDEGASKGGEQMD